MTAGPVDTSKSPYARWRALPAGGVSLGQGFWSRRQAVNRDASLHHCWEQLEAAGNFNNLRLAAGSGEGEFRGMLFADSDVYKWLEAVAYDLAARPDARLQGRAEEAIDLLAAAQSDDGYLNSYWQVVEPDRRWQDLGRGHEMYCAGHLVQAAVAYHRATGRGKLLDVARRFADHIDSVFGPTGRRRHTRASGDRDSPGGAVPPHGRGALSRPRAPPAGPAGQGDVEPGAVRLRLLPGSRARPRGGHHGRPRRAPAVPGRRRGRPLPGVRRPSHLPRP